MREEKVTKNIITKETIARELLSENHKVMRFCMILFIALTAFMGIIFLILYSLVLKSNDIGILAWVIYFISMLICFFPSFLCILFVFASLSQRKRLKNGEFFVVTDEVDYKEEKSIIRRGHIYIEETINFYKYGDIHIKNHTWYQLTSKDDVYYIVVYTLDSKTPQKYYPAKMYEYKE